MNASAYSAMGVPTIRAIKCLSTLVILLSLISLLASSANAQSEVTMSVTGPGGSAHSVTRYAGGTVTLEFTQTTPDGSGETMTVSGKLSDLDLDNVYFSIDSRYERFGARLQCKADRGDCVSEQGAGNTSDLSAWCDSEVECRQFIDFLKQAQGQQPIQKQPTPQPAAPARAPALAVAPAGAPYISDVKDKVLPEEHATPTPEEREAADLLRESRCIALMSTYHSGPARSLPSECMSEAEAMSVYTPVGGSQPQLPPSPEPVIDGSQIPSIIDFALGPPSGPSDSISQALQQLPNQDHIGDLPSEPAAQPSSSPTPSVSQLNGSQFNGVQEDSETGTTVSSPASGDGQDGDAESASGSAGIIDKIFEAGQNAREGLKNIQIQVGDRLRGITRDADGAPVKIGSKGNTKTDSNQNDIDKLLDQ